MSRPNSASLASSRPSSAKNLATALSSRTPSAKGSLSSSEQKTASKLLPLLSRLGSTSGLFSSNKSSQASLQSSSRKDPKKQLTGDQKQEISEMFHFFKDSTTPLMTAFQLRIMARAMGFHFSESEFSPILAKSLGLHVPTSFTLENVIAVFTILFNEKD